MLALTPFGLYNPAILGHGEVAAYELYEGY